MKKFKMIVNREKPLVSRGMYHNRHQSPEISTNQDNELSISTTQHVMNKFFQIRAIYFYKETQMRRCLKIILVQQVILLMYHTISHLWVVDIGLWFGSDLSFSLVDCHQIQLIRLKRDYNSLSYIMHKVITRHEMKM